MQEIQGTLMAAWRASGGAIEAMAPQPETGDDGLAATALSRRVGCFADDGLAATAATGYFPPYCNVADEGLAATAMTDAYRCVLADDGLAATAYSHRWPYCLAQ